MGGRGRVQENKDRWDWVKELSDTRLENYGKMTFWKDPYGYKDKTDWGKESLNWECVKEFERRKGYHPDWEIKGVR
jgi:hypothetical protein